MTQSWIPARFYRGGSSKGVFFNASDLPSDRAEIEPILLNVLGSPDPNSRQLNGMGGGLSSLSKAVILSRSARDDADVDYLFAQIAVDRPIVEWGANCGNLSSAVGPCALEMGLVEAGDVSIRSIPIRLSTPASRHETVSQSRPGPLSWLASPQAGHASRSISLTLAVRSPQHSCPQAMQSTSSTLTANKSRSRL